MNSCPPSQPDRLIGRVIRTPQIVQGCFPTPVFAGKNTDGKFSIGIPEDDMGFRSMIEVIGGSIYNRRCSCIMHKIPGVFVLKLPG